MVERLREVEAQLTEADRSLADARRDLAALDAGVIDVEDLRRALEEFEPLWAELSTPERARVLALLLERVTFNAETGVVEFRFRPGCPRLLHSPTCPASGTSLGNGQANHSSSGGHR